MKNHKIKGGERDVVDLNCSFVSMKEFKDHLLQSMLLNVFKFIIEYTRHAIFEISLTSIFVLYVNLQF